jgi:cyclopropane fatty-acyl-phospholipid synthase-like methyltransferase
MARDEDQARALFEERYRTTPPPVLRRIEQRVIGKDWWADGYTTIEEVDVLARRLHLSASDRLLDLGTGRGWPGLYLAAHCRCRAVLTDLPLGGLRLAAKRVAAEGLAGRTSIVASAASALPFRPNSFDAIVHTDVLC